MCSQVALGVSLYKILEMYFYIMVLSSCLAPAIHVKVRLRIRLIACQLLLIVTFCICCRLVTEKKPEEDSLIWALFLVSAVVLREITEKCVDFPSSVV